MNSSKNYRKGVFFIVYSRNKKGNVEYLVLKRKLHWNGWEFPKGGIEKGEKSFHTVQREIKEETKLTPLNMKKFDISGKYKYKHGLRDRPGIEGQTYEDLYAVEVKKQKVKVDNVEHSDSKWLSFEQTHKILTWENQKDCLKIVNEWIKKTNKFRKFKTNSGTILFLGKTEKQNEELVNLFRGSKNVILHTKAPGSPFCVIDNLKPSKLDIKTASTLCAFYSQNWRNTKSDVIVNQFTGKDISKNKGMKIGTFGVKKSKNIKIKKGEILKLKNAESITSSNR